MATPSQVDTGLDAIAAAIAQATQLQEAAKQSMLRARSLLAQLPTEHADVISTINGYSPTGAFETLAKDKKAKLQAEFVALKTELEGYLDSLSVSYS